MAGEASTRLSTGVDGLDRVLDGGLSVFPKLVPDAHSQRYTREQLPTGDEGLDAMLHGGLDRGTITLVSGPSGVGKSTTASMVLSAAASRGETAAAFLFEEPVESFLLRADDLGIPAREMYESGALTLRAVEPLRMSTDEFSNTVRETVEDDDVDVVLVDGTAAYRLSLHNETEDLVGELHALCRYLRNMGVTVLLTEEIHTVTGEFRASDSHVSYLADTDVFLRYLEQQGRMQKAVGVLKRRLGGFDSTVRTLDVDADGYHVGEAVTGVVGGRGTDEGAAGPGGGDAGP